MSQASVEQIIGKLVISPEFRAAVVVDPAAVLAEYDLSAEERQSILSADLASIGDAAAMLDERINKWCPVRTGVTFC